MPTLQDALKQARTSLAEGRRAEAASICQSILNQRPEEPNALHTLGLIALNSGQPAAAIPFFQRATAAVPENAALESDLGLAYQRAGQLQKACDSYRRAAELDPSLIIAQFNLGVLLQQAGHPGQAAGVYARILQRQPRHAHTHANLGVCLLDLGNMMGAMAKFREALEIDPRIAHAHTNLAALLGGLGEIEEAFQHYRSALELDPGNEDAAAGQASLLERQGKAREAMEILDPLIQAGSRNADIALVFVAVCHALGEDSRARAWVERALENPSAYPASKRSALFTALGRLCDTAGDYDLAFSFYVKGNALRAKPFDPPDFRRQIDELIALFTPEFFAETPRAASADALPVFIVGMPRSGTSLVEQILASHPSMHGAGELRDIGRIAMEIASADGYAEGLRKLGQDQLDAFAEAHLRRLRALDAEAQRITDKMPGNFLHLGLIARLFPGARIIHCQRNPLDTCLSCYFAEFVGAHPYSYDLGHLGFYYRQYLRLMEHWRSVLPLPLYEIRYEELVENQEPLSRDLVEFCGLEWDARCLRFHENKRFVATASRSQVTQPMYRSSVGRSKHYEHHLGPLKEALAAHP